MGQFLGHVHHIMDLQPDTKAQRCKPTDLKLGIYPLPAVDVNTGRFNGVPETKPRGALEQDAVMHHRHALNAE